MPTDRGFVIDEVATAAAPRSQVEIDEAMGSLVEMAIHLRGAGSLSDLGAARSELDGVEGVDATTAYA